MHKLGDGRWAMGEKSKTLLVLVTKACGWVVYTPRVFLCLSSFGCAQALIANIADRVQTPSLEQFVQVLWAGFYPTYARFLNLLNMGFGAIYTGPTIKTTNCINSLII